MLPMTVLKALLLFSIAAEAVPTRSVVQTIKPREEIDEDDSVVYAWALPNDDGKIKREEVDEDDSVVYAWALPESDADTQKREEQDEDDSVVYAWALPATEGSEGPA